MNPEGPIAAGAGAILVSVAAAITAWVKNRPLPAQVVAVAVADDDVDRAREMDSERVLQINTLLQASAQRLGGDSALLLLWEPTDTGGEATVLAEWPGVGEPTALRYQHTELGQAYRREVIDPLRQDGWLVIRPEDLTAGSELSDLYTVLGTRVSWVHLVLEDDDGGVLYLSTRFTAPPEGEDASIREELRLLTTHVVEYLK